MLIEFRVTNFRSFRDEQVLSLVASSDKVLQQNLIKCEKFDLLKTAAIWGANASGKSNLLKAFSFMTMLVRESATKLNLGDPIPEVSPFRLDKKTSGEPSVFEISVIVEKTRYEYGFSVTTDRVVDEWLVAYPPPYGRAQRWLERGFDLKTGKESWKFRSQLKSNEKLLRERTRENCLVLSRGAELNIKELQPLFLWFRQKNWYFSLSDSPVSLIQMTADHVVKDELFRKKIVRLIRDADTDIYDIDFEKKAIEIDELPKSIRKEMVEKLGEKFLKENLHSFDIHSHHKVEGIKKPVHFDFASEESQGTQRLFAIAGPIVDALDTGGVTVIVDEFECSMHPLLTRKLIDLFQSPKSNRHGAQLVFATHNDDLLSQTTFRRDQIWLVEKNSGSASEIFSLADLASQDKPRKTEAFRKNYLAGRYGGIPKFGPTFEDLEIE